MRPYQSESQTGSEIYKYSWKIQKVMCVDNRHWVRLHAKLKESVLFHSPRATGSRDCCFCSGQETRSLADEQLRPGPPVSFSRGWALKSGKPHRMTDKVRTKSISHEERRVPFEEQNQYPIKKLAHSRTRSFLPFLPDGFHIQGSVFLVLPFYEKEGLQFVSFCLHYFPGSIPFLFAFTCWTWEGACNLFMSLCVPGQRRHVGVWTLYVVTGWKFELCLREQRSWIGAATGVGWGTNHQLYPELIVPVFILVIEAPGVSVGIGPLRHLWALVNFISPSPHEK